jgi:hypothetical protein
MANREGKKYIAPGGWFSMIYPSSWNEFEDSEDAFLFYNPEQWSGNFRISAFRNTDARMGNIHYGDDAFDTELKENKSAKYVQIGTFDCAYSSDTFDEDGKRYISHLWITGKGDTMLECSFTASIDEKIDVAKSIISSIEIRNEGQKYQAEIIPVRLSEIYRIDDAFDKVGRMVKEQLSKDFQGVEEDLANIQSALEKLQPSVKKNETWLNVGIAICCILATEIDGLEWMTLIDGNREDAVMVYKNDKSVIDPMKLMWSKVKKGEPWNVVEAYEEAVAALG